MANVYVYGGDINIPNAAAAAAAGGGQQVEVHEHSIVEPSDDPASADVAAQRARRANRPLPAEHEQEARAILLRRLQMSEDEDALLSSVMKPGESPRDVLNRTSFIFQQRVESSEYYARELAGLVPGTIDFEQKKHSAQRRRIAEVYKAMTSGEFDAIIPRAVRGSRDWFKKQKQSFPMFSNEYSNLTPWGNMVQQMSGDIEVIAAPGQNTEDFWRMRVTCLAAGRFNLGLSLMDLVAGDSGVGKSWMLKCSEEMLPDGQVMSMSYLSTLALSNDSNEDHMVLIIHETDPKMTQETFDKTGVDGGASFIKSLLTDKISIIRALNYDKGRRNAECHVTSKMWTGLFATNHTLELDSPLLKRYFVLKPSFDGDLLLKINRIQTASVNETRTNALHRERVLAHFVQLVEIMIGMGVLDMPDMSQYTIFFNRVCSEMAESHFPLSDIKGGNMAQQVVLTCVTMCAVGEAMMMEHGCELRYDFDKQCARKFDDVVVDLLMNVNRRLVAQEPVIVFGLYLCRNLFGNDTEAKIIDAARRVLNFETEGTKIVLPAGTKALPVSAEFDAASNKKKIKYDWHYIELLPASGRGTNEVVGTLLSVMPDRQGRSHIQTSLEAMTHKTIAHNTYGQINQSLAKIALLEDDDVTKTRNPLFTRRWLPDNHEDVLLENDKFKQKPVPRWYVNVAAFRHRPSQSEAMKSALLKCTHANTEEARHLISEPYVAPAYTRENAKKVSFFSLPAFIDFTPDITNVLVHHSRHSLLESQIESMSAARMYLGGDPSLAGIGGLELDRRSRLVAERSLALQAPAAVVTSNIDFDVFIKRQTECGEMTPFADYMHWSNFRDVCRYYREKLPEIFESISARDYPAHPLKFAQKRNLKIDAALSDASMEDKHALLPSVTSLLMSGIQSPPAPPLLQLEKRFATGGMVAVRSMFVDERVSTKEIYALDADSNEVLRGNADAAETWRTARRILHIYRDGETTASFVLRLAGFKMSVFIDARDVEKKVVSLERLDAVEVPNRSTIAPTVTERLARKRPLDALLDASFEAAAAHAPSQLDSNSGALFDPRAAHVHAPAPAERRSIVSHESEVVTRAHVASSMRMFRGFDVAKVLSESTYKEPALSAYENMAGLVKKSRKEDDNIFVANPANGSNMIATVYGEY